MLPTMPGAVHKKSKEVLFGPSGLSFRDELDLK